jgi:hypothetical protein
LVSRAAVARLSGKWIQRETAARELARGTRLGAATAVAGLFILAAPAVAADPPTLTGSAPVAARGPGMVWFTYTIDVVVGLDSAKLTTHQDSLLPADAGSVTFDGTAVARSQIAVSGGDLTIPLGTVATGAHTVRFTARVPAAPSTVTRSTADLSYGQAGVTQDSLHSAAVVVDINEPDIEVLSDFGDPVPEQPVGTGTFGGWDFSVRNIGFGAPPTTLRFTVPEGLDMTAMDVQRETSPPVPLRCSPSTPGQLECALGTLAYREFVGVSITFAASASAIPATTASLAITATPDQGVDQDPSNNTITVPIRFTGLADLTSRVTTPTPKVTVGHSTVVTVTVHNNGPQPAHVTIAFVSLDLFNDQFGHFQFTRFDGDTGGAPLDSGFIEWIIGTLEPGKTATAHLTVRAISVGTGNITVDTESTAGDPSSCKQKFCGPRLTLTAIAETPTPTPTPTPTAHVTPTPPAGSHQLAATGTSPWPLTWLGSALLATGAILTYQGRRRGKRT